jgi:hypothetical protein
MVVVLEEGEAGLVVDHEPAQTSPDALEGDGRCSVGVESVEQGVAQGRLPSAVEGVDDAHLAGEVAVDGAGGHTRLLGQQRHGRCAEAA